MPEFGGDRDLPNPGGVRAAPPPAPGPELGGCPQPFLGANSPSQHPYRSGSGSALVPAASRPCSVGCISPSGAPGSADPPSAGSVGPAPPAAVGPGARSGRDAPHPSSNWEREGEDVDCHSSGHRSTSVASTYPPVQTQGSRHHRNVPVSPERRGGDTSPAPGSPWVTEPQNSVTATSRVGRHLPNLSLFQFRTSWEETRPVSDTDEL